jgi:MATE family multidrug resistance protein
VVAGHQIALNVSSLVFMIPYSLGMAVTVRVGQALGAVQEPREARFAAKVGHGYRTGVRLRFQRRMMLLPARAHRLDLHRLTRL